MGRLFWEWRRTKMVETLVLSEVQALCDKANDRRNVAAQQQARAMEARRLTHAERLSRFGTNRPILLPDYSHAPMLLPEHFHYAGQDHLQNKLPVSENHIQMYNQRKINSRQYTKDQICRLHKIGGGEFGSTMHMRPTRRRLRTGSREAIRYFDDGKRDQCQHSRRVFTCPCRYDADGSLGVMSTDCLWPAPHRCSQCRELAAY